jgi:glutathione peroxidase
LPKIAEKEDNTFALGVGLLSLVTMLGVGIRRVLQPATIHASSGVLTDMPINMAPGPGENIMEMNSQVSAINGAAAREIRNPYKETSRSIGWGQLSSQNSPPLTFCYATAPGKETGSFGFFDPLGFGEGICDSQGSEARAQYLHPQQQHVDRRTALLWSAGVAGLVALPAVAEDLPPAALPESTAAPALAEEAAPPQRPLAAITEDLQPAGAPPAEEKPPASAKIFDVTLPFNGKELPLSKFRGDAHLVVNIKMDDPLASANFNGMKYIAKEYPGLRVWAIPTDQGYYEPDVSELVRAKAYQQFGFGMYPTAVVFDKIDVQGKTIHPLYAYLGTYPDPNGVNRLTLNYEKFLLDKNGRVLRRYPRKFTAYDFEADVNAATSGRPLPPPSAAFKDAWVKAASEAQKGEYSFRSNYNVWDQSEPSIDWQGLADLGFT